MDGSGDAKRLWATALHLNRAASAVIPACARLPPLIFVTDPERTPRPWEIAARLPPGAAVIFRHFGADDAHDRGQRLRLATRDAGVRLLIGQDEGLAAAVEADGLHLPQRDLARGPALRRTHPDWLLTGASHDAGALTQAGDAGLDAALLSPLFSPGGRSDGTPLGIEKFNVMSDAASLPVYALGGVTAATTARLRTLRACGLCAVDGVTRAFGESTT